MPTYVYKFIDSGETIEVQQSFTDDALTEAVHPSTGETMAVKKVFLPVGVTFKGDGFYKTDSRSSKQAAGSSEKGSGSGGSDSSAGESSSSSSSESSNSSSERSKPSDSSSSGASSGSGSSSPSSTTSGSGD